MSRAYRVKVRETARHVIRAEDHVGTTLELLEVLPREAMADLLRQELLGRGFEAKGESLVRRAGGTTVEVEPATGAVTVRAEHAEEVTVAAQREGYADTDWGSQGKARAEETLREKLRDDLRAQADRKARDLQTKVTDRLEGELAGLRAEFDRVVNRVTAEALKRKAAQLGQIKELTEDPEAGSLTIVLEV